MLKKCGASNAPGAARASTPRRACVDAPPPARLTPWTQGLTCAPGDCGPDAADARDAKTCEASGGVMPTARRHWRRRGASWPAAEQRMPGVAPAGHRTPSQTFSFSPSPYGPSTADDTLPTSICGSYSRVSVRVASASLRGPSFLLTFRDPAASSFILGHPLQLDRSRSDLDA